MTGTQVELIIRASQLASANIDLASQSQRSGLFRRIGQVRGRWMLREVNNLFRLSEGNTHEICSIQTKSFLTK